MSAWSMTAGKGQGGGTEKAPPGNHVAVLVGIFDMGRQWQEPFDKSKEGYYQHRAYFVWELVNEQIAGTTGKNHVIGIDLTLSLNEKAKLRKWVEARTGRVIPDGSAFDPTTELGQPCMLNVVEKNGYPKVEGVAAVPKGTTVPGPTYTPVAVLLSEFEAGTPIPDWCPWLYGSPLADHINACEEIGGDRPKPRKGQQQQTQGGQTRGGGAPADAPPADAAPADLTGPDPTARWDYHDGRVWVLGASTQDVTTHIVSGKLDPAAVWVRPAGGGKEASKKANAFGFSADPIPW